MIDDLMRLAELAEGTGKIGEAIKARRDAAELMGYLKAPPTPAEDVDLDDPEERKRIICEAAAHYGMVFKDGAK